MTKKSNKVRVIDKPELFQHIEGDIYCFPTVVYNNCYNDGNGRPSSWVEHGLYHIDHPNEIVRYQNLVKAIMELCETTIDGAIKALVNHSIHTSLGKILISRNEIDYRKNPL